MVLHREQAKFDRARWRKAILVPFWIAQLALLLGLMGLFSYRLASTIATYEEEDGKGNLPIVEVVWECTNVGMSLLALILTIVELAKMGSETLTPWTMLFTHVMKLACACAILGLDIVVYLHRTEGNYSLIGLAMDIALIAIVLIPGIYSVATYRRLSHAGAYLYPANAKGYGFSGIDLERNTSYSSRISLTAPNDPRRHSAASTHRSSVHSTAYDSIPLDSLARDGSQYSHQRDTAFDDYMAARTSLSLKDNIDRAVAAEFGWSGGHAGGSADDDLARRASVVAAGAVPGARHVEAPHVSYDAKGLAAVPEIAEDDEEPPVAGRLRDRSGSAGSDQQALLGAHSRHHSEDLELGAIADVDDGDMGNNKRKWQHATQ